ncbi:unnamed protein product [Acanthosepion pharaonis]|uniref:Uncharacterized protein n=1 Tax=Acanthosepion pharaonis TaxID=158019 RepID=A0A812E6I2_ACAPH|nr:unnamed protein product [Sepia pharaonis]
MRATDGNFRLDVLPLLIRGRVDFLKIIGPCQLNHLPTSLLACKLLSYCYFLFLFNFFLFLPYQSSYFLPLLFDRILFFFSLTRLTLSFSPLFNQSFVFFAFNRRLPFLFILSSTSFELFLFSFLFNFFIFSLIQPLPFSTLVWLVPFPTYSTSFFFPPLFNLSLFFFPPLYNASLFFFFLYSTSPFSFPFFIQPLPFLFLSCLASSLFFFSLI